MLQVKKTYKVTIVGGGTGSFTVLSGLKKYPNLKLSAVITSFDSGGSSGRLRDEFGYLPVGDFRQALVALASENKNENLMRNLFNFRFSKKTSSLKGHNLGNIILTTLTEILGSEKEAIAKIGSIFKINGEIFPITQNRNTHLFAQYKNGKVVKGESLIDEPKIDHDLTSPISNIWLEPEPKISPDAAKAIAKSDLLVFGPGDFFTSTMPNTQVKGFGLAMKKHHGKIMFVTNLINKIGQTYGMKLSDYLVQFEKFVGKKPDFLLINKVQLPKPLLKRYATEGSFPIENDLKKSESKSPIKIIRSNLLGKSKITSPKGDILKRSLLRHDPNKLAKEIVKILAKIDRKSAS